MTSGGVGLVHHQPGAVFFLERDNFPQRRGITVHAENTFGDDEDADE